MMRERSAPFDAGRHFEPQVAAGLAITHEPVGAERQRERGEPRVMGCIGEPVDAARQQSGELAGEKQFLSRSSVVLLAEQDTTERAVRSRQKGMPARDRLEPGCLRKGAGIAIEAGANVAPVGGIDEPDRDGVGAAGRQQDRMHKKGSAVNRGPC